MTRVELRLHHQNAYGTLLCDMGPYEPEYRIEATDGRIASPWCKRAQDAWNAVGPEFDGLHRETEEEAAARYRADRKASKERAAVRRLASAYVSDEMGDNG